MNLKMLEFVRTIPGAISMTEAVALYDTIKRQLLSVNGHAVDLGSHAGKSSTIAACALSELGWGDDTIFMAVDLLYDRHNPAWANTVQGSADNIPWGYTNNPIFALTVEHNIEKFSGIRAVTFGLSSEQFFTKGRPNLIYAFIDTDDHVYEKVKAEMGWLEDLVQPGGLVFFHDFGNQFTGPRQVHEEAIATGKYEDIPIDWDYAIAFTKNNNLEEGNISWHCRQIDNPSFIGCMRRA